LFVPRRHDDEWEDEDGREVVSRGVRHGVGGNRCGRTKILSGSPGQALRVLGLEPRAELKQEFSNTQAKLIQTWGVDEAGRLLLTAKLESMTLVTPERKAVFDRQ
jgi:hypothetical protein